MPTARRYTGQRLDAATGLYFYNARYYDPGLARFTQPDTIVPDPGDPQSLNRYSYAGNNPLRYTDPSGFFSEDEIMKYLHVDNWDAVLAMFNDGGQFAGAWGFLEVLRQAELGDTAQADYTHIPKEGWRDTCTLLKGIFTEQDGNLMLSLLESDAVVDAGLLGYLGSYNRKNISYWVNQNYVGNYAHTHVVDRGVDWVSVGFDTAGIAADVLTDGIGGRIVNSAQAALTAKSVGAVVDMLSVSYTSGKMIERLMKGELPYAELGDVGLDLLGIPIPVVPDLVSIITELRHNLYIGP